MHCHRYLLRWLSEFPPVPKDFRRCGSLLRMEFSALLLKSCEERATERGSSCRPLQHHCWSSFEPSPPILLRNQAFSAQRPCDQPRRGERFLRAEGTAERRERAGSGVDCIAWLA